MNKDKDIELDELTSLKIDYIMFVEKTREMAENLRKLCEDKLKIYEDHISSLKAEISDLRALNLLGKTDNSGSIVGFVSGEVDRTISLQHYVHDDEDMIRWLKEELIAQGLSEDSAQEISDAFYEMEFNISIDAEKKTYSINIK